MRSKDNMSNLTYYVLTTATTRMPPRRKHNDASKLSARDRLMTFNMADIRMIRVQETSTANGSTPINNQGSTVAYSSADPSFSATVSVYSQTLFCRWPTWTVFSHAGFKFVSFDRFTEVRLFHLLRVVFNKSKAFRPKI